jgi:hypothetical protein
VRDRDDPFRKGDGRRNRRNDRDINREMIKSKISLRGHG